SQEGRLRAKPEGRFVGRLPRGRWTSGRRRVSKRSTEHLEIADEEGQDRTGQRRIRKRLVDLRSRIFQRRTYEADVREKRRQRISEIVGKQCQKLRQLVMWGAHRRDRFYHTSRKAQRLRLTELGDAGTDETQDCFAALHHLGNRPAGNEPCREGPGVQRAVGAGFVE